MLKIIIKKNVKGEIEPAGKYIKRRKKKKKKNIR